MTRIATGIAKITVIPDAKATFDPDPDPTKCDNIIITIMLLLNRSHCNNYYVTSI